MKHSFTCARVGHKKNKCKLQERVWIGKMGEKSFQLQLQSSPFSDTLFGNVVW
jgi:hypothetical protein